MPAPHEILALVEKFDHCLNEYRSSRYNEEELRVEFINPFFEALGWDVNNRQGLSGDAKEVKNEDAARIACDINRQLAAAKGEHAMLQRQTEATDLQIDAGLRAVRADGGGDQDCGRGIRYKSTGEKYKMQTGDNHV